MGDQDSWALLSVQRLGISSRGDPSDVGLVPPRGWTTQGTYVSVIRLSGEILGSLVLLQSLPVFRGYFDGYISTTQGRRNGTIWLAAICGGLRDSRRQKGCPDQTDAFSFAERNCPTSLVYIKCTRVGYIKTGGYLHTRQNLLHRSVDDFAAI